MTSDLLFRDNTVTADFLLRDGFLSFLEFSRPGVHAVLKKAIEITGVTACKLSHNYYSNCCGRYRLTFPYLKITEEEQRQAGFDRQVDTDRACIVIDAHPDTIVYLREVAKLPHRPASPEPFGMVPINVYAKPRQDIPPAPPELQELAEALRTSDMMTRPHLLERLYGISKEVWPRIPGIDDLIKYEKDWLKTFPAMTAQSMNKRNKGRIMSPMMVIDLAELEGETLALFLVGASLIGKRIQDLTVEWKQRVGVDADKYTQVVSQPYNEFAVENLCLKGYTWVLHGTREKEEGE